MSERLTHLITRLQEKGEATLAFFRTIEDPHALIYEPWDSRAILAHLVAAERSIHWLIENVAQGGPGTPEDFDLDRFNAGQTRKMAEVSMETLYEQFRATREATIEIVRSIPESALDNVGRHPFVGEKPLEQIIKIVYRHCDLHQREIAGALGMEVARGR